MNNIHIGKIFSNGKDKIFEVENYWFTNTNYNKVKVNVRILDKNGKYISIGKRELDYKELLPIPRGKKEYKHLIEYNKENF